MPVATLTTFILYVVVMFAITWVAWRNTRNLGDYLLGGRNLSAPVAALSAGASDMSGWLLLGLPGAVYLGGLGQTWIVTGLLAGAWLNWTLVARRLRISTESLQALTLPDYLSSRFDDHTHALRVVSALVILMFFTFYTASGLVAGAVLFSSTFGFSYPFALMVGATVIVGYTMIGGFLAVSWTDFVQGLLMLFALVTVPSMMYLELGGFRGISTLFEGLDPALISFTSGSTLIGIVSLLAWGLGYSGQPHILARFMAIDSPANLHLARTIAMGWMLVTILAAVAVGLLAIVYLRQIGQPLGDDDAESVFLRLTQLLFNPWIGGVLLAAILAAVMSTIDSQLLVSSSALSEDFYKALIHPDASEDHLVLVGRLTVLAVAIVAVVIASDPQSRVLELVSYAWAGLGASFGPVIVLSLYYRSMNRHGALAGMITGATVVVVWKQLEGGIFDLYELLPAFVLSALAVVLFSEYTGRISRESHS